jgi:hypothetical protein
MPRIVPMDSRPLNARGHRASGDRGERPHAAGRRGCALVAICSSVRPLRWAPDLLALRFASGCAIWALPRSVAEPDEVDREDAQPEITPVTSALSAFRNRCNT